LSQEGQFPTLGFVVDAYKKARNFVSENFWYITMSLETEGQAVAFSWQRGHLFDQQIVNAIHSLLQEINLATVIQVTSKPTQKWKPYPLTTVELQKLGSNLLRISSDRIMQVLA
jgi:DNA topoisomerase-3